MELTIKNYIAGSRPEVTKPIPEFYAFLKEDGIRRLVSRHYDLLSQSSIKQLFPPTVEGLEMAKVHSADFMIQICGGPMYYHQHRGQPMMVKRHAPFTITAQARLVWLSCYKQALQELDLPQEILLSFWNYIQVFSAWMVNTESN